MQKSLLQILNNLINRIKTIKIKDRVCNDAIRGFLSPRHGASPGLRMGE